MPATTFLEYAATLRTDVEQIVAAGFADVLTFTVDPRSAVRGFIKGHLQFTDGSVLHFREFIDLTRGQPKIMYAYHYQLEALARVSEDFRRVVADKSLVLYNDALCQQQSLRRGAGGGPGAGATVGPSSGAAL